jgi:hypothetical protein
MNGLRWLVYTHSVCQKAGKMSDSKEGKSKKKKKASSKDEDGSSKKKHKSSQAWNEFEENTLIKEMKEGKSLASIAKAHGREETAIKKRLVVMLGKMLKEGFSFESALKAVRVTKEEFADFLITGKFKS